MSYKSKEELRNCINGRNIIDLTVNGEESFFHFDHGDYSYSIDFDEKDYIECIETFDLNIIRTLSTFVDYTGTPIVKERERELKPNDYDLLNEPDIIAECIGNGMHFIVSQVINNNSPARRALKKLRKLVGMEGKNE
jgi:hypothetical protein